jgi:hypothetical protein
MQLRVTFNKDSAHQVFMDPPPNCFQSTYMAFQWSTLIARTLSDLESAPFVIILVANATIFYLPYDQNQMARLDLDFYGGTWESFKNIFFCTIQ